MTINLVAKKAHAIWQKSKDKIAVIEKRLYSKNVRRGLIAHSKHLHLKDEADEEPVI